MQNIFVTIQRGKTPEEAFLVAQAMGWNGPEICQKEGLIMFNVPDLPDTETPADYAFKMAQSLRKGKVSLPREMSGCIKIKEADHAAKPNKLFDLRLHAYMFFGLA